MKHGARWRGARGLRRGVAGGTLAALLAAQAGCYTTRPVSGPVPPAGTRVVASLTPTGSDQLESQVGPRVAAVEGVVQRVRGDTLELGVVRTIGRDAFSTEWAGETVHLPQPLVADLRERSLDQRRSVLAAVVLAGGALLLARAVGGIFGGQGEGPPPPTPPN